MSLFRPKRYMLGVTHASTEELKRVASRIRKLEPDSVALELSEGHKPDEVFNYFTLLASELRAMRFGVFHPRSPTVLPIDHPVYCESNELMARLAIALGAGAAREKFVEDCDDAAFALRDAWRLAKDGYHSPAAMASEIKAKRWDLALAEKILAFYDQLARDYPDPDERLKIVTKGFFLNVSMRNEHFYKRIKELDPDIVVLGVGHTDWLTDVLPAYRHIRPDEI